METYLVANIFEAIGMVKTETDYEHVSSRVRNWSHFVVGCRLCTREMG